MWVFPASWFSMPRLGYRSAAGSPGVDLPTLHFLQRWQWRLVQPKATTTYPFDHRERWDRRAFARGRMYAGQRSSANVRSGWP
ncbi:hypothetical protein EAH80_01790 [Mycobacterium hodleri]|uniref:Uncharacterized protein n=1 Tax=Mycolicibacterium hodleri TaxID=49897 RepID=A0A502EJL3_9MYCO|nr:hypothetical protein EAH80_01790 [Mycolicibacterium hodleri]